VIRVHFPRSKSKPPPQRRPKSKHQRRHKLRVAGRGAYETEGHYCCARAYETIEKPLACIKKPDTNKALQAVIAK
jgi:hypothetical protein